LLRWYHEGVNAFEHTCAIGQAMFRQFETELAQCLSHPEKQADIDSLLSRTREAAQALVSELSQGRDRLLELNSCDPERAEQIVNDLHDLDHDRALPAYMERVFDLFGVEQEHHTTGSIIIRPGEHMIGHHFPGLPEEGITATFRRDIALAREDFQFLTWEHPMVTGAMDMVMSGELGNTAFCALKLPLLKPGTILLEAMFTSSSPAPHGLQLHRYLPLTTIRVVVDSKQNDLSAILTEKHFSKLGQKVRRHQAQEFIRHARRQINPMIETAEQLAADQEKALVEAAQTKMEEMQRSELQRLQALAKVNPNIRQEEISYLTEETNQLAHFLEHTYIKLEALRVAVVSQ
jgi:ATP-dependent helicase HepA